MDGVLYLTSPDLASSDPPIGRNTPLRVEAACVSGQADDQTLLRVDSINKQYADQVALANVAFDIQAGEIVGIIGPNGAGKTTLLEVLAGILPAETNDVHWLGRPLLVTPRGMVMVIITIILTITIFELLFGGIRWAGPILARLQDARPGQDATADVDAHQV